MGRLKKKARCPAGICTAVILCLFAAVFLSGCVKKYTRSDIASYAKKVTGSGSLTVSEGYREIQEDEEGYLDHLWTVTNEENGVTFHVLDDYYWAMEQVRNQLRDDYDSSVFISLLERKKLPLDNELTMKTKQDSGLVLAEVFTGFTSRQGPEKSYQELLSLRDAAEAAGCAGLKLPYTVRYLNPLRGAVDYEVDEGDTSGELGSVDGDALALMRRNYLICALDYRFEDVLQGFSEEEIHAIVHDPATVRIYKEAGASSSSAGSGTTADPARETGNPPGGLETDGERVYYEGVIGSPQYAGISFGTLYELLRIEGRRPKGNAWHYSFTAQDGSAIEISYDFNDLSGFNDAQGRLQKGYYYIRDGKKIRMSSYYANHFEASEIEALTGLKVAEDRKYVTH